MLLILCILLVKSVTSQEVQNKYYSLYRITAFNANERKVLYDMYTKSESIVFLSGITNDAGLPMDILVNSCCTDEFEMNLQDTYIEYVHVDNDLIYNELYDVNMYNHTLKSEPDVKDNFLDWDNLVAWVDSRCKKYASLEKIPMESTYEKRDMLLLKLSSGGQKPAVFIIGGEQGRDWMSTAIVLNFLNTLLENPQEPLLQVFDFYILPLFNPDGYEYSMKYDRFWNKNRKSFFPLKKCKSKKVAVGVDIDRNWFLKNSPNYHNEECLSVYLGNRCITEEETKALSIFLNSIATNLLAFINLRGYENIITVPYAETDEYADNQAVLMEMLLFATTTVERVFNKPYKFCNTASCFFNFSGNSADWVKARLNVPVVYTMYMQQKPFILPHPEHIISLSDQFTVMAREMLVLGSNIYGPLFSKQTCLSSEIEIVILFCLFISIFQ